MERDKTNKLLNDLMQMAVDKGASDMFVTAGFPPAIKVDGMVQKLSEQAFDARQTVVIARALMTDRQAAEFERNKECSFAVSVAGIGRFRINAFFQQGKVGLVMRHIADHVPTLDALGLPAVFKQMSMAQRGICLMVGATGSGKSTTMAAMLNWRNEKSMGHIITIEDPIEVVHPHRNCVVTQREVGVDTNSWESAIKNAMRQAPDVILMGEIRDQESMEQAIAISNTGHLCLATLHANNANQALDRIVNFFPENKRHQVLQDLSLNLVSIVSQRLAIREDKRGRALALEIMLNSAMISDLVAKGAVEEIKDVIKKSQSQGMQTFDQSLFELFENRVISYSEAIRNADSVNDLRIMIKISSERAKSSDLAAGTEHLRFI